MRTLFARDAAAVAATPGPSPLLSPSTTSCMWKLTTNRYTARADLSLPHFPFHVDLPANGPVTFVVALRGAARFEIKPVSSAEGAPATDANAAASAAAGSEGKGAGRSVPPRLYNGSLHDVSAVHAASSPAPSVTGSHAQSTDSSGGSGDGAWACDVAAGTLIVLSGAARWQWMHRVTPLEPGRIAIVLGARPIA